MKDYIYKRQRQGKIIGSIGAVSLVAFVALCVIGASTNISALIGVGFGCFVACVPLLVVFFELYQPTISSYNYLKKHNLMEFIDDINLNMVDLPYSKIHFGKRVFFSKKSRAVVPYDMVLWAHIKVVYTNGIKSEEKLELGCRDGKWFSIKVEKQELPSLIQAVASHSPDLILGYGNEQNNRYYEQVKSYRKKQKEQN